MAWVTSARPPDNWELSPFWRPFGPPCLWCGVGINYAFFCYDVVAIAVLMGHCAWYSFIIAGVAFSGTALFEAVSGADAADLRPHLHFVLARYVYIWPLWSAMRKIRLCQSPVLCMFLHIQLVYVHNTRHV